MRFLVLASLLALSLAGCSDFLSSTPEGCGKERRHHADLRDSPTSHAIVRKEGEAFVYLWEIPVTGACKKQHVDIDLEVVINEGHLIPDEDDIACSPVQVRGSAYRPGSFVSARTIPMTATGLDGGSLLNTYKGSDSYGLKQNAQLEGDDDPASYTVDVEVVSPIDDGDEEWARDCAAVMVHRVEITAVDLVDE